MKINVICMVGIPRCYTYQDKGTIRYNLLMYVYKTPKYCTMWLVDFGYVLRVRYTDFVAARENNRFSIRWLCT